MGLLLALTACNACSAQPAGQALDMTQLSLSFDEAFKTMDIAAVGGARWSAHTPWHGDFGDAAFSDPGPDGPFSLSPGGLLITARKDSTGHWRSGLICSIDKDGPDRHGFSQQYGYFEMRARLPEGMGVWPAFWLIGVDKTHYAAEIDVMEFYGGFPGYYHNVAHIWENGRDDRVQSHLTAVPAGSLSAGFNDFGVLIEPETTTFYLNRRSIWSIPTPVEYRQPMYMLANLALGGGWPTNKLSSAKIMEIQYIKAFRRVQAPAHP